jgi:hypothetical protein
MTTQKLASKKQKIADKPSPSTPVSSTTGDVDPSQNAQERPVEKKKEKQKIR